VVKGVIAPAPSLFSLIVLQMMSHRIFALGCLLTVILQLSDCLCNNGKWIKTSFCLRPIAEVLPLTNDFKVFQEFWAQKNWMNFGSSKMPPC
jgi:hypothetical protein